MVLEVVRLAWPMEADQYVDERLLVDIGWPLEPVWVPQGSSSRG